MASNVEHTDEFAQWYQDLSEAQQDDLTAIALLLTSNACFDCANFSPLNLAFWQSRLQCCNTRIRHLGATKIKDAEVAQSQYSVFKEHQPTPGGPVARRGRPERFAPFIP